MFSKLNEEFPGILIILINSFRYGRELKLILNQGVEW